MAEGRPRTKAASEDAAHFLVRMVRRYPHEVTVYAGGPLTDLAMAQAIDPEFAGLARELVVMGGSIHPQTSDPEFVAAPRREFNFWMDPEAAHRVLHAGWRRITVTTVDIAVKTRMTRELAAQIARGKTPGAEYAAKYAQDDYMWDELAALGWIDPGIITRSREMRMDVSTDHGATYGDTLVWADEAKSGGAGATVNVQEDLDTGKFYREFVELMRRGRKSE